MATAERSGLAARVERTGTAIVLLEDRVSRLRWRVDEPAYTREVDALHARLAARLAAPPSPAVAPEPEPARDSLAGIVAQCAELTRLLAALDVELSGVRARLAAASGADATWARAVLAGCAAERVALADETAALVVAAAMPAAATSG